MGEGIMRMMGPGKIVLGKDLLYINKRFMQIFWSRKLEQGPR